MKIRVVTIVMTALLGCSGMVGAQEVVFGVRGGVNASHGGFASLSLDGLHRFENNASLQGGVLWSTIGRKAVEFRPAYSLELDWATLCVQALTHYTNQNHINNFAVGAGLGLTHKWLFCNFGYYYRTYGGRGGRINEPFNLFYNLGVRLLDGVENWDLTVALTNSEMFELERHYAPSVVALCRWSAGESIGILFGLNYKPSGTFHMSSDLYQLQFRTGLCYKW